VTPDAPLAQQTAEAGEPRHPSPPLRLRAARMRLQTALQALENALSLQAERSIAGADQVAEFELMQEDRSRLALQLDHALDRLGALETAHAEAARRVERASAAVRAVLAAGQGES
jgi:hypothetical protein